MRKLASSLLMSTLLGLALQIAPAQAQLARTFVSAATGNDAANCDRPTPCRTFQHAHDNTLALGEITVLDPGGYGAVTITKGISIINDGVGEGGVLVSGGATGITISAPSTDAVSLRGITVKGIGFGGGSGIWFKTGKSLTVENCAIRNLTGNTGANGIGMLFSPVSVAGKLAMTNTIITDNDVEGLLVEPSGTGSVTATINRSEFYNNPFAGINVLGDITSGTIAVAVTDSVAGGNGDGFLVPSVPGHPGPTLMVARSTIAFNNIGVITSGARAILWLGQSTVTGNALSTSGSVLSFGDNNIAGNADGDPPPATIAKK